jgi:hypothetical protein
LKLFDLQAARQRAQENEAWRSVKKYALAILHELQDGGPVPLAPILLQPSFYETKDLWITLQFLVSFCPRPVFS